MKGFAAGQQTGKVCEKGRKFLVKACDRELPGMGAEPWPPGLSKKPQVWRKPCQPVRYKNLPRSSASTYITGSEAAAGESTGRNAYSTGAPAVPNEVLAV